MNLFDLTGKKAIVTGGAGGLGLGITEGLLEAGAEVAIVARSAAADEAARAFYEKGYRCHAVRGDVSDASSRKALFERAVAVLDGLDILVNNAGIQRRHPSEEFPLEDWQAVLDTNLTALFAMCQLAGQYFLQNGGGKIINLASMLSFFGGYTVPAYAAAKGGVAQLTKALANEWAGRGICVNAIAPGYMDTPMNVALINDPVRNDEILKRIPAKRWGTPADMKGPAVFLASSASDYLNGAIIPVDGGYLGR
ncbi:SDR family oxidoreductase [Oscillospiraceae bacterium LTW-04]|nr:SDR family oxidoreductase [Oscillospiraceae bacterium MB24-C1]